MSAAAGIDGCRSGWILAVLQSDFRLKISHLQKLGDWKEIADFDKIFIDIPLYFATDKYRETELAARKILGKKASSVFLSPNFNALLQDTYTKACKVNEQLMGKKISVQYWHLKTKILEAAEFHKQNQNACIFESHPEIAFFMLNDYKHLQSKKAKEGIKERMELLSKRIPKVHNIVSDFLQGRKYKNDFGPDDILDAVVLALSAAQDDFMELKSSDSDDTMIFGQFNKI